MKTKYPSDPIQTLKTALSYGNFSEPQMAGLIHNLLNEIESDWAVQDYEASDSVKEIEMEIKELLIKSITSPEPQVVGHITELVSNTKPKAEVVDVVLEGDDLRAGLE